MDTSTCKHITFYWNKKCNFTEYYNITILQFSICGFYVVFLLYCVSVCVELHRIIYTRTDDVTRSAVTHRHRVSDFKYRVAQKK